MTGKQNQPGAVATVSAVTPSASPPVADHQPRRAPSQRRSRERVERILAAASALIAERGSDALRMSEVAQAAAVSIGSLYQYFPDKGAIIRLLAERYNEEGRACVRGELATVRDDDSLRAAMLRILDGYYGMFLSEPVMRDIWSGAQADKALQAMDAEDGRIHSEMLAAVLYRLRPEMDREQLLNHAYMIMQLLCATVRMAIALERRQGDAIIAAFRGLLLRELFPVD
jgi:AcrR family transcriptional regulator